MQENRNNYLSNAAKSRETLLEVNLHHVAHNLNYYRAKLKKGVKVLVMVKANAYGAGAVRIAQLLQNENVDYLSVAYADEGVALRKAGITLPILVLNTELSALDDIFNFGLEPEVYSQRILDAVLKEAGKRTLAKPLPIHLKIETGMNRLGFAPEDLPTVISQIKECNEVKVASVFSHLAAADEPAERKFTQQQIERFERSAELVEKTLGHSVCKHVLNSSGISQFPEAQFDMVRLGIGLYGVSSFPHQAKELKPISVLKATVSQVKKLKEGDTVGYGRHYAAKSNETIAIIAIGYGDGFLRSMGNGRAEVYIAGNRYPVVGNVCMDMIMVNVTGENIKEGELAEIFGENITVYEVAKWRNTIPYEVLTSVSQRVKKVYL